MCDYDISSSYSLFPMGMKEPRALEGAILTHSEALIYQKAIFNHKAGVNDQETYSI